MKFPKLHRQTGPSRLNLLHAAELDELPLPCRYDVRPFAAITLRSLREHIERVGIPLYPEAG